VDPGGGQRARAKAHVLGDRFWCRNRPDHRAHRQVFDEVLGYVHDATALEWGMRQITVARCFERIGDNAVDIGEQTAFLVSGELREFTDASH
jgi:phosphate transport system protein